MFNYFNSYVLYPVLEKGLKRNILPKLNELRKWDRISPADKKEIISKKLNHILKISQNEVPYYKELFKRKNFDPDLVLKDVKYLQDLPVLTKQIILEQGSRMFRSNNYTALHPRKTGGSTGKSVVFYYDNEALDWTAAAHLYAVELTGKKRIDTEIHLCGDINEEKMSLRNTLIDSIKLASLNRSKLMVSGFSENNLNQYYQQLLNERPYLVQGHPSTMYAISQFVKDKNLPVVKVCDVFEPSGEALNDKMVQSIQHYLGCKVYNRYGNAELGVIAHSLKDDSYKRLKILDMLAYVESTSEKEILVTGLFNYSMPLIRYSTGDLCTVVETPMGSYLEDIEGRVHDSVNIAGSSYPTHFIMDYLDHRVGGIVEFQILVNENEFPLLRIVPSSWDDINRIKELVVKRWPEGLRLVFIKHEQLIQVGWRGKFRHVITNQESVK